MSEDTATPQRYCPPQSGAIPEAHKRDGKMMRHAACVLAVAFALVPAAAQNAGNPGVPPDMTTPVNAAPNPYRTVKDYFKLPAGRTWGSTSAVEIDRDATVSGFRSDKAMADAGVREIGYIKVYRGDKRIAGVYYATGALTSASEEIIAGQLGTRTLRSGDKIFFKAYNRDTGQDNLDINAWLNSF